MTASPRALDAQEGVVLRHGQQTASAELGLLAIAGVSPDDLFSYAVQLVRSAMQADFVWIRPSIRRSTVLPNGSGKPSGSTP